MSMYSLLQRKATPTDADVELCLDGNICRCTGYRPILEAFKEIAHEQATLDVEDFDRAASMTCADRACSAVCARPGPDACRNGTRPLRITTADASWTTPTSLSALLTELKGVVPAPYMLVHGYTSTGIYKDPTPPTLINVAEVPELRGVSAGSALTIGAGESITTLMDALTQVM